MKTRSILLTLLGLCLACQATLLADDSNQGSNQGQATLDKATILKLQAKNLNQLGEVVKLCEEAISKGLDDENKDLALQLMTNTLLQRATSVSSLIFAPRPNRQWVRLRQYALADLEKAVSYDPKFAQGYLLIAKLQRLPGGDMKRAKEAIETAVKTAKIKKLKVKALIARAAIQEKLELQLKDLNEAVKVEADNPDAIRARGVYYFSQKKYKESLADLSKAIKLLPSHAATHEAKAMTLMMMDKDSEAIKSFTQAIKLNYRAVNAYTNRARLYAIAKKTDKAMEDLNQAIKIQPTHLAARMLRSQILQIQKKYPAALKDVEEILRLRPGVVRAINMRAGILAAMGKVDEAIRQLERITELAPDNSELLFTLGTLYSDKKLYDKAITTYDSAIEADNKNWMAIRARGDLLLNMGQQKKALENYELAIKLQPKNSGLLNNLAWLLATSPNEKIRNGKRSIELGKQACEVTKYQKPHIISTLAAGYAESGDFKTAKKWSTKALELGKKQKLDKKLIEALEKELKSYQEKKPTRELKKEKSKEEEPDFSDAV